MPLPAAIPLIAALGPEVIGVLARLADWGMAAGGVSQSATGRKWASSLSNLGGLSSLFEAYTPDSWTGEKIPTVAVPATGVGLLTSFGAKAPLQAATLPAKAGRLGKIAQGGAQFVKNSAGWTVFPRIQEGIRSFAPSAGGASGVGMPLPDEGQADGGGVPLAAYWTSPTEAALVAAAAHYPQMYRGYIDTINARTAAQMQALKSVLPQYQQAMESAQQAAGAQQAATQQTENMLRQMLLQGWQQATFLRPWEEVHKDQAFID